jgi:glucose-6-phosphate isomerase
VTTSTQPDVTRSPEWQKLQAHHTDVADLHLWELFDTDAERGRDFTVTAGGLFIDYSLHRIDRTTLGLLTDLARAAGVEEHRDRMLRGDHVNTTENRAVLHTALRRPADAALPLEGRDVAADVHRVTTARMVFRLRQTAIAH